MTTFMRVDRPDADAVTIVFWSRDGFPRCRMLGPTKLIFGQPFELGGPAEGSSLVPLALTVGMQFAKDVAVPLVIWDPEELWEDSWGILSERNAIAPSRADATTECSPSLTAATTLQDDAIGEVFGRLGPEGTAQLF